MNGREKRCCSSQWPSDGPVAVAAAAAPRGAVEAGQVGHHAVKPRRDQMRALGEQAVRRAAVVLEVAAPVADAEAHRRGLRGDAEAAQQPLEVRVVAVVEDDEAGVDVVGLVRRVDPDGVGVAAGVAGGLEHGDLVLATASRWATTSPETPAPTIAIFIVELAFYPSGLRHRLQRSGLLVAGAACAGRSASAWTAVMLRRGAVAADRLLETAQSLAERAAHLGQALGSEHEQDDDEDDGDVDGVLESHGVSPISVRRLQVLYGPADRLARISRLRSGALITGACVGHLAAAERLGGDHDQVHTAQAPGHVDVTIALGGDAEQGAGRLRRVSRPAQPHLVDLPAGGGVEAVQDQLGVSAGHADLGGARGTRSPGRGRRGRPETRGAELQRPEGDRDDGEGRCERQRRAGQPEPRGAPARRGAGHRLRGRRRRAGRRPQPPAPGGAAPSGADSCGALSGSTLTTC